MRIVCDLCKKGTAFSFETNYLDLIKKDTFLLNDIEIKPNDWYCNLPHLFHCTDNKHVSKVFELFKKKEFVDNYRYDRDEKNYKIANCIHLTTTFDKIDNFNNVTMYKDGKIVEVDICSDCLDWIKIIHGERIEYDFQGFNPLIIFWNHVYDDIKEEIIFLNSDDKSYIENIFSDYYKNAPDEHPYFF